jgi:divalent metal cation (Fe/Co/Zn/Cd) transporter
MAKTPVLELPIARPSAAPPEERESLAQRARWLAWVSVGWHAAEAAVAIAAGVAAGSIALVGFGADSLVEASAGSIVIWRLARGRVASVRAERRAQQLIALSFYAVALYVIAESLSTLASGAHPQASWVGIGLAAVTLVAMPPLAAAKARIGARLQSSATVSEGRQNLLCAYLSVALLIGLAGNALAGLWWLDPAAGLTVAAVALREGRAAWRGDACACCE